MSKTIRKRKKLFLVGAAAFLILSLWAISTSAGQPQTRAERINDRREVPLDVRVPWGLDASAVRIPPDNPITAEKVELGKFLFFDRRLSADGTVSCADCHNPKFAFTDGKPVATGIRGQAGTRSAPTIINRAFSSAQFWDGRARSLEEQAKGPMVNPIEMGNRSHAEVVARLKAIPGYRALFEEAFGEEDFTIDHVAKAIATFERTVLSGNSPFDRFQRGYREALSAAAERGFHLFRGKAGCITCHTGFNFTDEQFHTFGAGYEQTGSDLGLYNVTKRERDKWKFKTPTLREIAKTAPYMHDGRFKTLEEVVDFYDRGGAPEDLPPDYDPSPSYTGVCLPVPSIAKGRRGAVIQALPVVLPSLLGTTIQAPLPEVFKGSRRAPKVHGEIVPIGLSRGEKRDLVEFLKSLSGLGWQYIEIPERFPE